MKGLPKDMRILSYLTLFNPLTVMHYWWTWATYDIQERTLYGMLDDILECRRPRRTLREVEPAWCLRHRIPYLGYQAGSTLT